MNKDYINSVAHLLSVMKEDAEKLEEAVGKKDAEKVASLKQEILNLYLQINSLI
ncbi:MAG: hypothetical protein AABX35_03700 [Nanoarchaeota archaeon]